MNERSQLWRILEAVFVCVVFASLYAIGGSGDFFGGEKWIRRFLAPAIFCVWSFVRGGYNWRYLASMPLLMGSLCLPYGADQPLIKFLLRALFGLANGTTSIFPEILQGNYILPGFHILLVTIMSTYMGVLNPLDNAMAEQFVIGFTIVFIPSMCVKRKTS